MKILRLLILVTTTVVILAALHFGSRGIGAQRLPAALPETERLSLNNNQAEANQASDLPDVSNDGRFIVFSSKANNLVSGDNNGKQDIFVRDRLNDAIERVNVSNGGSQANGDSFAPAISGNGRFVVYYSLASNLVNGDDNGKTDIFVYDRNTDRTELANVVLDGATNGDSRDPDISTDGQYVVFTSSATNLVGNDLNFKDDIFRWDRLAQTMVRVSVDSNGVEANDHSRDPAVSGNGQRIAFTSPANNLILGDANSAADIFVRHLADGTTERVSVNSDGNEAQGESMEPAISRSGNHVVFVSFASNFVSDDDNGYPDVFLRNLSTGRTRRISLASDGSEPDDWSEQPSVSADGRFVTFQSYATTLVSGDVPGTRDVFVRDRTLDTLIRASNSSLAAGGNGSSKDPMLAADGRFVAFSSRASDLVANDNNGARDIFIFDYSVEPSLTIDYTIGAPGSTFVATGAAWLPNTTVAVWVNGLQLGSVQANGGGELAFQLITDSNTSEGGYVVTAVQGEISKIVSFTVKSSAPVHPGSGAGFTIPAGLALSQFTYLPLTSVE